MKQLRVHHTASYKCPQCRQVGALISGDYISHKINDLKVCCPGKKDGCSAKPFISDLKEHYSKCSYKQSQCPNKGCEFSGLKKAVLDHQKECPYQIVGCVNESSGCRQRMMLYQVEAHLETCAFMVTECPNAGCNAQIQKNVLKEHEKTCPFSQVSCDNEGCGQPYLRMELENHQLLGCPHQKILCPYCQKKIKRKEIMQHKLGCESRPQKCGLCDESVCIKGMGDHQQICLREFQPQCTGCKKLAGVVNQALDRESSESMKVTTLISRVNRLESQNQGLEQRLTDVTRELDKLLCTLRAKPEGEPVLSDSDDDDLPESISFTNCELKRIFDASEKIVYQARGEKVEGDVKCLFVSRRMRTELCSELSGDITFCISICDYHMHVDICKIDNYLGVYIGLKAGRNDDDLEWPFNKRIVLGILDKTGTLTNIRNFKLAQNLAVRPSAETKCVMHGYDHFIHLNDIARWLINFRHLIICVKVI